MKGAVLDYITSKLARIGITTRLSYKTRYELADLSDDDLVTKYLLGTLVPNTPIITNVTAGDPQPLTIPYAPLISPNVIYRNPDGSRYGGSTDTDNGTDIVVTGDGGSTFADTFTVIVQGG